MMNKLIIANWKAYLKTAEVLELLESLMGDHSKILQSKTYGNTNFIIAPSTLYLALIKTNFPDLTLAAQDVSDITGKYGAYTGETPAIMLGDMGIKYVIIGHSERRANGLDDADTIAAKVYHAVASGITPIICVGETKEERARGEYLDVVAAQIRGMNLATDASIIIAYEPTWSVGTGVVPSLNEISEMMNLIRSTLRIAGKPKLVYGGSVSAENVKNIVNIPGVDGVLIGKASTDAAKFKEIIRQLC
jgi:triosephosphate isomerase